MLILAEAFWSISDHLPYLLKEAVFILQKFCLHLCISHFKLKSSIPVRTKLIDMVVQVFILSAFCDCRTSWPRCWLSFPFCTWTYRRRLLQSELQERLGIRRWSQTVITPSSRTSRNGLEFLSNFVFLHLKSHRPHYFC